MFKKLYFGLGIANNIFLISIFLIRTNTVLLEKVGIFYFLLVIPAIIGLFLAGKEEDAVPFKIFLGIFVAFLVIEFLYDYILKIPFRQNLSQNWVPLIPYLALYYAMNYGFVVMVWKTSLRKGLLMLSLFIIQIIVNIYTH